MDTETPSIQAPAPSLPGLLGDVSKGLIPPSHVSQMKAVIGTVPGPGEDWRSLLVTNALAPAFEAFGLAETEAVVVTASDTSSVARRRYRRNGWRELSIEGLYERVFGEQAFRRLKQFSSPKMCQSSVRDFIASNKADPRLMWPVLKVLENFYASADNAPTTHHLVRDSDRDRLALEIAQDYWHQQLNDPLGSKLGMPVTAMGKLWRHQGGAWPEEAPNLLPRLIAVADAEKLSESTLQGLLAQPAAVTFFGDPAQGIDSASVEEIRNLPLGSSVLGQTGVTTLSLGGALEEAVRNRQQNDIEINDAWIQAAAGLSATVLGFHREEFDVFRSVAGRESTTKRLPPLVSSSPTVYLSRFGAESLRQQLQALRGNRGPVVIEGTGDWKNTLSQAEEIATVMLSPKQEWPQKLQKRYPRGAEAALYAWSHSPERRALITVLNRERSSELLNEIKLLSGIPFRARRLIKPSGLTEVPNTQPDGWVVTRKGSLEAQQGHHAVVALSDDADDTVQPGVRGHYLYAQFANQPISLAEGESCPSTIGFISQACRWLDKQHEMNEQPASAPFTPETAVASDSEIEAHLPEHEVDAEYWAEIVERSADVEPTTDIDAGMPEEELSDPPMHQDEMQAEPHVEPDSTHQLQAHSGSAANEIHYSSDEPHWASRMESIAPGINSYSDRMLEDAAAHEAMLNGEEAPGLVEEYSGMFEERESLESMVAESASPSLYTTSNHEASQETTSLWQNVVNTIRNRQLSARQDAPENEREQRSEPKPLPFRTPGM